MTGRKKTKLFTFCLAERFLPFMALLSTYILIFCTFAPDFSHRGARVIPVSYTHLQSAKLNGVTLNQPWFNHSDIAAGGLLELEMGPKANKEWGLGTPPPSAAPRPK